MTIRLVGTCPVCEAQQKVTPGGTMVHHGYRRPGTGFIHGDCPGVRHKAYELSSEGCEYYRDLCAKTKEGQEEWLRELRSRPVTIDRWSEFKKQTFTYRRDSTDPQEQYSYEQELRSKIQGAEYRIRGLDGDMARMTALIERWAPAPLIEIDEEGFTPKKREERAERKAERDAKRAEKKRKRAELAVRRNKTLARKATTLLFFFEEFEKLAQQPPSPARNAYARDLLFEIQKKKYNLNYPHALWHGPDDGYGNHTPGPWGDAVLKHAKQTLVTLGLAQVHHHQHGDYVSVDQIHSSRGSKIRVPEPTEDALEIIATMQPLV